MVGKLSEEVVRHPRKVYCLRTFNAVANEQCRVSSFHLLRDGRTYREVRMAGYRLYVEDEYVYVTSSTRNFYLLIAKLITIVQIDWQHPDCTLQHLPVEGRT